MLSKLTTHSVGPPSTPGESLSSDTSPRWVSSARQRGLHHGPPFGRFTASDILRKVRFEVDNAG